MKTLWNNIKFLFFFLILGFVLDYLLDKSTLPITLSDVFYICFAIIVYILLFVGFKEYFFGKPRIFTETELPLWKLFAYMIFFLILLIIGVYMSYIGIMSPLELIEVKGGLCHGYSIASFGSGFTLLMLIFNIGYFRSIFLEIKRSLSR